MKARPAHANDIHTDTDTDTDDTAVSTAEPVQSSSAGSHPQRNLRPGWQQVVLVCKACEKRSKGPKKFGAKDVSRALSSALRQARSPKTRIVQTTCMGLCPKKAVAVAAAARHAEAGGVGVIAWRRAEDPDRALAALFVRNEAPVPAD